jgi:signal transduction histidine kinase
MKLNAPMEPGLIRIFRFFVIAETVAFMFVPLGEWVFTGEVSQFYSDPFYFIFLQALLLSIYLSIPWLQRKLRSLYLMIALLVAALIPVIIVNIDLTTRVLSGQGLEMYRLWALLPLLMIALVPAAWQYDFRIVFIVNTSIGLLDGLYLILLFGGFSFDLLMPLFAIFIRVMTLNLVGLMISELIVTQREQRRDLMYANLKLSQQALVQEQLAVSRERNRLARELHDTLAHTLSGLSVQLEAIHTILPKEQQEVNQMLETALYTSRNGLEETRRALKALRAEPLEDLGLRLSIQNLITNLKARTNLHFHLAYDELNAVFSPEEEQTIYRISQEALENVIHHANAKNVWYRFEQNQDAYILSIRDDGKGFKPEELSGKRDRLGIKGMRERAEMIHAQLEILSEPAKGTALKLVLRK